MDIEDRVRSLETFAQNITSIMFLYTSVKKGKMKEFETAILQCFQELGIPYETPSSHEPGDVPTPTVVAPGSSST